MTDKTKLLVVRTGAGTPETVDVSLVDLREAVLNRPEVLVEALRDLIGGAGGAPSVGGDLPMDTPVAKMVGPDAATTLTPAARKLTKADILALGGFLGPPKTTKDLGLDLKDVQSLESAFHMDFHAAIVAGFDEEMGGAEVGESLTVGDIKCCCCPCCCCTAAVELEPVQAIA